MAALPSRVKPDEPMVASAQKLHIAFYCSLMAWPKPSSGGVRPWALSLANALVARGHAVDVLSEAPPDRFVDEPLLDSRVGRVILGKGLMARLRLIAYVRRHPDLHLVTALNRYNLGAVMLKPLFGPRVHLCLTQHENLSADVAWKKPNKYRLTAFAVRRYFNKADAVVAVSRGLADDLRDNWGVAPARIHVIYNPAFDDRCVEKSRVAVPHRWLSKKTLPVIIAAGRLHAVKGFDNLLHAFARLRARLDSRLIILGEGPERRSLESLVGELRLCEDVSMPGHVPEVAPWFARADVFALSSRREGFANVLVEALAAGLPIVATRCPSGPDEVLDRGRWGTLVDVGNVEQMSDALHRALVEPRCDIAALRGRAMEFSVDRAIERYLDLWAAADGAAAAPAPRVRADGLSVP